MDKGNQYWISVKPLKKALRALKSLSTENVSFIANTINAWNDKSDYFVTVRMPNELFRGRTNYVVLSDYVNSIQADTIKVAVTDRKITFFRRRGYTSLNYSDDITDEESFDLWNESIDWFNVPRDLIEGTSLVSSAADIGDAFEQQNLHHVYVYKNKVFALDLHRVGIYRLKLSAPFNMILSPQIISKVLTIFRKFKLRRVAQIEFKDRDTSIQGVAFDLGDVRVWLPMSELDHEEEDELKNLKEWEKKDRELAACFKMDMDRRSIRGPFKIKWTDICGQMDFLVSTPCEFLVELPADFRKLLQPFMKLIKDPYSSANDDLIILKLMLSTKGRRGELHIHSEHPLHTLTDTAPIRLFGKLSDSEFYVHIRWLYNVVRGSCLLGYIPNKENKSAGILYLRSQKCEYFMGIGVHNSKTRGTER